MKFPLVSRWKYEDLLSDKENMVWSYEKNLDLMQAKLDGLGARINELEAKNDGLLTDNRTLLNRIGDISIELAKWQKEARDLKLLKEAMEARWVQKVEEAEG